MTTAENRPGQGSGPEQMGRFRGYLLVLGAAFLWASFGLFSRELLSRGVSPTSLVTFRAGFGAIAFLTWSLLADRRGLAAAARRDALFFAVYGLLGITCFYHSLVIAFSRGTVAMAVVLMYTAPAYVAVASARLFGEKLTAVKWAALGLTFGGVVLITGLHRGGLSGEPIAILAGLGAGVGYAFYNVAGRIALTRHSLPVTLAWTFTCGAAFSAVLWSAQAPAQWPVVAGSLGYIIVMAVVTAILPYTLYLSSFRFIETGRAAITASIEPVLATILAALVLGERPGAGAVAGAAFVLAGVMLVQAPDGRAGMQVSSGRPGADVGDVDGDVPT
jgi:DME family drug/metabolite transporter